jgi:hypothetical protein
MIRQFKTELPLSPTLLPREKGARSLVPSPSGLRCPHKSEQSQNTHNPLLGGVPVGWGGLVMVRLTNPPLPLPRGDFCIGL